MRQTPAGAFLLGVFIVGASGALISATSNNGRQQSRLAREREMHSQIMTAAAVRPGVAQPAMHPETEALPETRVAPDTAANQEISGTVTQIDTIARTVTIHEDPRVAVGPQAAAVAETKLALGDDVTVFRDSERLSVYDVRIGDRIKAVLQEQAGQRIVRIIRLNAALAPALR